MEIKFSRDRVVVNGTPPGMTPMRDGDDTFYILAPGQYMDRKTMLNTFALEVINWREPTVHLLMEAGMVHRDASELIVEVQTIKRLRGDRNGIKR